MSEPCRICRKSHGDDVENRYVERLVTDGAEHCCAVDHCDEAMCYCDNCDFDQRDEDERTFQNFVVQPDIERMTRR